MSILQPVLRPVLQPLSLSLTRAGAAMWNPRALFAGGYKGLALDLSNRSVLYQDAARTTLVSASGDPIGSPSDISGNGNHPTQATTTSRPLWLASNAAFDGVDDSWATPAIDFTGTDKVTVVMALQKLSDAATGVVLEESFSNSGNDGSLRITAPQGAAPTYGFSLRGTGQTAGSDALIQVGGIAAPTTSVLSCVFDLTKPSSDQQIVPRVNGATPATSAAGLTYAGNGKFGNYPFFLGARAGTSLRFKGGVYRVIVIGRALTSSELKAAERWCAAPAGVVLP